MKTLRLAADECQAIQGLLDELCASYPSAEEARFLNDACVISHDLPRRVRGFINELRNGEPPSGLGIISGFGVDEARIGPTPKDWKDNQKQGGDVREEMLLVLYASLLGDPFAWASEQAARIVHDIVAIKDHEDKQMSTGSQQEIWWHTEEAFHPFAADYLGLLCLRNPDRVATTFAAIDSVVLAPGHLDVLFEPRFRFLRVESHLQQGQGAEVEEPSRAAILFGSRKSPYLRIDPYFMDLKDLDPDAREALSALSAEIQRNLSEFVLAPGDCVLIDNYKVVHGRKPFRARYDGQGRWLKRISVSRDLRKSRGDLSAHGARTVV